jgi:Predicted integral membrane protein
VFIFYISIITVPPETVVDVGKDAIIQLNKLRHFVAYAVLGIALAYATTDWDINTLYLAVLVVGVTVIYGVGIEFSQSFRPNRSFSLGDAYLNAFGGVLATSYYLITTYIEFVPAVSFLGSFIDQFDPPRGDTLSERQVQSRLSEVVMNMSEPQPVSWFVNETGGDKSTVEGVLENHLTVGNLETYGDSKGQILLGPPGIDPSRTTIELQEKQYDDFNSFELGFPDGHIERAHTYSVGNCTVAASTEGETIAVFVDGDLSFTIDEYVKTTSLPVVCHLSTRLSCLHLR